MASLEQEAAVLFCFLGIVFFIILFPFSLLIIAAGAAIILNR